MSPLLAFTLSLHFLQISYAKPDCTPSACGIVPNISSPFRLKGDPNHCGDRRFELVCENNITSLYLDSRQFYVKAINYSTINPTIRLVDASMNSYDTCSFPNSSTYSINFDNVYYFLDNVYVSLMRCPHPLDNSSLFTDVTHCGNSSSGLSYIKVGHLLPSEIKHMCRVEMIAQTSWRGFRDSHNASLLEIHRSLLYGFEVEASAASPWTWQRVSLPLATLLIVAYIYITYFHAFHPPTSSPILYFITNGLTSTVVICAPRFIIFPLAVWLLVYKFRRRHLSTFNVIESFLQSDDNKLMPIQYSYQQIKKMSGNFREKIGEGGYGQVYKGKLRSGQFVAVKLLGKSGSSVKDFINEIATIGRIHHVNIIGLIGFCADGSKRALVYDFMPNGSLEKYILNPKKANYLSWDQKFDIAVGVARGIEYLHRGCDVQILHFDIKPHNILLDDNFTPKLSDFGLAKSCSTDKAAVTMTFARGTIGYVAPELINRSIGAVSYKADVYSFGMMLMEIACLKRDLDENNGDSSMCFPYWIYDYFNNGRDVEIGIVEANNDCYENERKRIVVRKMAIVALWCTQMNPNDRPSMNKVLEMMEGDVERLQVPTCPSQSSQDVVNMNESESSYSAHSLPLFGTHVSSSLEIAIQK